MVIIQYILHIIKYIIYALINIGAKCIEKEDEMGTINLKCMGGGLLWNIPY